MASHTTHAFLEGLRPTLHIAHRGGATLAPENTVAAFDAAVGRWRTDLLEIDVRPTADGEIVVFHDDVLDRCTDGTGPVEALTWSALQTLDAGNAHPDFRGRGVRVPRLADVLDRFPTLRFNIELKAGDARTVAAFIDLLRSRDALHRVCIGSESDTIAAAVYAACPEACHFFPAEALTAWVMAVKTGAPLPVDPRWSVIDMPFEWQGMRLVDADLLQAARSAGLWVNVWTVDEPEEMRYLVGLGVGGIMTDRPDLLREVLAEIL
jgi:glycerophosphoryl diester phosphodiesterase